MHLLFGTSGEVAFSSRSTGSMCLVEDLSEFNILWCVPEFAQCTGGENYCVGLFGWLGTKAAELDYFS